MEEVSPLEKVMEELRGEGPAFVAMMTSPGYKLWDSYAEVMEGTYREAIVYAKTYEDWQEAKSNFDAIQKARLMPQMLLEKIRSLDSADEPTDAP